MEVPRVGGAGLIMGRLQDSICGKLWVGKWHKTVGMIGMLIVVGDYLRL